MPYVVTTDNYTISGEEYQDRDGREVASFDDATFLVMREMMSTASVEECVAVMREWFTHDGSTSFEITRDNGNNSSYGFIYTTV